jgi:cyanate permease
MGVVMVGMGIGAMIIVPAIAWAIDPEVMRLGWLPSFPWDLDLPEGRLGWRGTGLLVACIVFVCALILPRFIYSRPEDRGLYPDGDEGATPAAGGPAATTAHTEEGLTVGQALRTQAFWCISFGHGLGSMIILAIMSQLGLLMYDLGYGVPATAGVVTVYTAVSIVFQLAGGYIGDRVPKNIALFAFTGLQAAAVVILVLAPSLGMIFLFAVLFGAGFGGRTPLTTAIRGDYFGRASFGKILGISTLPMNAMLLIAGPMAGFMRDKLGDYDLAFLSLAGLNGIGALLFLIARRPRLPAAQPTPAPMVPAAAGDA